MQGQGRGELVRERRAQAELERMEERRREVLRNRRRVLYEQRERLMQELNEGDNGVIEDIIEIDDEEATMQLEEDRLNMGRGVLIMDELPEAAIELIGRTDNYRMKLFIQEVKNRYDEMTPSRVNEILGFINKKGSGMFNDVKYFDILEFYAVVNEGLEIHHLEQGEHRAHTLKTSVEEWCRGLDKHVRIQQRSGRLEPADVALLCDKPKQLIFRLTRQEIEFVIGYVTRIIPDEWSEVTKENYKRVIEYYMGRGLFELVEGDFEDQDSLRLIIAWDETDLRTAWEVAIIIIVFMNRVLSNHIHLTDLILAQNRYRAVTRYMTRAGGGVGISYINAIQAYPYIICPALEGERDVESVFVYKDLFDKFIYMLDRYPSLEEPLDPLSIWIKIKVRRTYSQKQQDGTSVKEMKYLVITLHPIAEYQRFQVGLSVDQAVVELRDETYFVGTIQAAFKEKLEENFDPTRAKYNDYETLDDNQTIDMSCIMISYTQISRRLNDAIITDPKDPENINFISPSSTILKPAYCTTASNGLIRKTAFFSEATAFGICLYEAYWTLIHLEQIREKNQIDGLKMRTRVDRKKLILRDLAKEDEDFKDIVLLGDIEKYKAFCASKNLQVFEWDIEPGADRLDNSKPTLLIFSKHCVCADTSKIKEEWRKKTNQRQRKHEERYTFRALPPPKEPPVERNFYLDIETSIDKETGIFTPYLICLIGEGQEHKWWGDECKQKFVEWVEENVDKEFNTSVGHKANKPKISIWTYNGMRFDLIFLVRSLVKLPLFDIKGSVDNIKALQVCNITFRDLLKIIPVGSLRMQSDFWGTEHKKGYENFDEITDEFITTLKKADLGLIPNQEECFEYIKRKDEIVKYCLLDCVVLKECVESYLKWVWDNLQINPYVISAAGLALKYFQTHHHPSKEIKDGVTITNHRRNLIGMSREDYDILKHSYKGGIVMNTRQVNDPLIITSEDPYTSSNILKLVDINSSYPHSMMGPIPVELERIVDYPSGGSSVLSDYNHITPWYLYGVYGLEWKEGTRIPTIPKRTEDGLNHTIKHSDIDYIWGKELSLAIDSGELKKGTFHKVLQFRPDKIFTSYVQELYENRRKKCKASGDKVGDKLYKLLLNSLYGKFGQKLYPEKKIVDESGLLYYASQIITPPTYIGEGLYSIIIDDISLDPEFHHEEDEIDTVKKASPSVGFLIHIASYIAASSRVALMKGVKEAGGYDNVYYMDTDSMIMKGSLPDYMIDPTELGMWAEEHSHIDTFISPAKKMYYISGLNEDGTRYEVCKSKGLTVGSMTKEDYIKLMKEGNISNVDGGEKWVRKDGYVRKQANVKTIKVGSHRMFYNNGMDSLPLYE